MKIPVFVMDLGSRDETQKDSDEQTNFLMKITVVVMRQFRNCLTTKIEISLFFLEPHPHQHAHYIPHYNTT